MGELSSRECGPAGTSSSQAGHEAQRIDEMIAETRFHDPGSKLELILISLSGSNRSDFGRRSIKTSRLRPDF